MAFNCGIVGLPNVGKSTIFSALTAAPAETANYPFCTIKPNKGIVQVADNRLKRIAAIIPAEKTVYTTIEFVDIAGLVRGTSAGAGLGNQFLANIRDTSLIVHVVRCFEDGDISHVNGGIDAERDIETIATELALADMATIDKAKGRYERLTRANDTKQRETCAVALPLLQHLESHLNQLKPARQLFVQKQWSKEELGILRDLHLLTAKPQIYLCNISETDLQNTQHNAQVQAVLRLAEAEQTQVQVICGKLEADIASIDDAAERKLFLQELGLCESGLEQLARLAYRSLGLGAFFTVGGKENRAWTFRLGETASQCAGIIHSDFEKDFIRAEVFHCEDLFAIDSKTDSKAGGNQAALRHAGKLRLEGKTYQVQDGDVLHFRFNT